MIKNDFFAFNNCVREGEYTNPAKQALLLRSLGYDGIEGYNVFRENGIDNLSKLLKSLDKNDLKLYTIYMHINLDNAENPYDPRLEEVFSMLKGRDTIPWFNISGQKYNLTSAKAVSVLQKIADMAHTYGLKIMIYPHINTWIETVKDAIRVAREVNRRNFGITFNLSHYLAVEGTQADKKLIPLAEEAIPYLFAISLNGADKPTTKIMEEPNMWDHFIKPLGEGSYDVSRFLRAFTNRGFKGPVGLQCYSIKEADEIHLKKSKKTWDSIISE